MSRCGSPHWAIRRFVLLNSRARSARSGVSPLFVLIGALTWGAAFSQEAPLEGLAAGPWILAPSLVVGYSYDTNVFQEEGNAALADYSIQIEPGIRARLPFRNSALDLSYKVTRFDYGQAFENAELAQQASALLDLHFSTSDRLQLSAGLTFGIAKTEEFDPGGEVRYDGNPYHYDEYRIDLSREVPSRPGYRVRAQHTKFRFDESAGTNFFNYEGNTGELEYRQPLGPGVWGTVGYIGSRFDHFCDELDPLGNPCPPSGEPFRKEETDSAILGVRGTIARNEVYFIRIGGTRFRYRPEHAPGFEGLTAEGSLGIPLGGGTSLRLGLLRRPYPSFYFNNDYYVVNRLDVEMAHHWPAGSTLGLRTSAWRSVYPNRLENPGTPLDGVQREDRQGRAELYATVMLVRRFGLDVSVSHQIRSSNVEGQDFEGTIYFAGVVYGFP